MISTRFCFIHGLLIISLISLDITSSAQTAMSTCNRAKALVQKIEKYHVEPSSLSDSLSNRIFQNFIHLLDPNQTYFNVANINEMEKWRYEIDDFIENKNCDFLEAITIFYKERINKSSDILNSFKSSALDFQKPDTLSYGYGDMQKPLVGTDNLRGRWEERIKFLMLSATWPEALEGNLLENSFLKVISKEKKKLESLVDDEEELRKSIEYKFLSAIAKSYDPHTNYFSIRDKNDFEASVSTEGLSYGLEFSNDPLGNLKVARIVPGSPAWQSNKIHDGDILINIKVNDGDEIDISSFYADELEALLAEVETEIEFTLKKVNGSLVKVRLKKSKVRSDDNIIKSLILNGYNKIAYISLPSFYSDFEDEFSGSASDLAKEVLNLKREGIDGIILDLRNNGGGSMNEAIQMSGVFIDRGAIAISKEKDIKPTTIKDPNLGTVYDGPLAILINGGSASASELFAGAMQDHNRGILIGSNTFGKATGQRIIPLNLSFDDFIKVTVLKFYRVTGDTHQKFGVQPDIFLNGMEESMGISERSLSGSLGAQHINKKTYYEALAPIPVDSLRKKSTERISNSQVYKELLNQKEKTSQYLESGRLLIPVSIEGYRQFNENIFTENSATEDIWGEINIELTERDKEISGIDDYGKSIYEILSKKLSTDIHLREAFSIVKDYIEIKSK